MRLFEDVPRICPFLWFDGNAEEAADFYVSVFPNSRRLDGVRSPVETSVPASKVLVVTFELDGQRFTALNGGPQFKFNEAISFVVRCETQEEVDHYWTKLTAGGSEGRCGWLKDKFGLSWQVVPAKLGQWISKPEGMKAMMGMTKLIIPELQRAAGVGTEVKDDAEALLLLDEADALFGKRGDVKDSHDRY